MDVLAIVLVGLGRAIWNCAFLILHPFFVHLGSDIADCWDFEVLWRIDWVDRSFYDRFDKSFDALYYLSAVLFLLVARRKSWYTPWLCLAGIYRIIGNVGYIITGWGPLLAAFPNVFGTLFCWITFLDVFGMTDLLRPPTTFISFVLKVVLFVTTMETWRHIIHRSAQFSKPKKCDDVITFLAEVWIHDLYLFGLLVCVGLRLGPVWDRTAKLRRELRVLLV
jgi:hypothetical protein